jgi:hypothetical protein
MKPLTVVVVLEVCVPAVLADDSNRLPQEK